MRSFIDTPQAVIGWLQQLAAVREVQFPQPQGQHNFSFEPIDGNSELDFDHYRPSVTPPVKRLMPAREVMFRFVRSDDGGFDFLPPEPPAQPVLAGVRPCDLRAISQMDAVMADEPADPLYLGRRAATPIIAYGCDQPCDERCFCGATGSIDQRDGADVFLTPVDGQLLVEPLTETGERLLADCGLGGCDDPEPLRRQALAARPDPFGRQLKAEPAELPEILRQHYDSPVYQQYGERCFSCGTCNLVCPTCYCFEVQDESALDGQSGERVRTWDACMNPGFAEVAGGHNFRDEIAERQRHRIKRKFEYLPERFDLGSFCTGCGRCGRQCTTGIDIYDMVNDIVAEHRADQEEQA